MADPHVDTNGKPQTGWFVKESGQSGRKTKSYRTECKRGGGGYIGPRYEAHHILPQTTIDESVETVVAAKDRSQDYVDAMKYLTSWDINNQGNLIGLPHVTAYMLYFQGNARIKAISEASKPWVSAFLAFQLASRKRWLSLINVKPPKNLPIHQPVSFGHEKYNRTITAELVEVWKGLDVRRKKHELTAKDLAGDLETKQKKWRGRLVTRGVTDEKAWNKMLKGDTGAHLPFCMINIPSPL
jgi:hypothetical protein